MYNSVDVWPATATMYRPNYFSSHSLMLAYVAGSTFARAFLLTLGTLSSLRRISRTRLTMERTISYKQILAAIHRYMWLTIRAGHAILHNLT